MYVSDTIQFPLFSPVMGAIISTTGNILSYSWGNDNWRIPGSEIQAVRITPRDNFGNAVPPVQGAYWSVDVVVSTRSEPYIFDLRTTPQDADGNVYRGWTNDQTGARFAAQEVLAIAGQGGGGGGSGLVNDGDYGAITVSMSGTVWTINPQVVDASMIDSGGANNGDVLTADGAGGAAWGPSSPGNGITDLTGDVTATGPGSAAAVIANNAVTNAKQADMAAGRVKMRLTGTGTGDPVDATMNQLSTTMDTDMTDRYAHISEITPVLTGINGDVVAGPGAGVQSSTIQPDAVTNAKLANMAAATFKMRALGSGTGDPIDGTPTQATDALATAVNPFVRTSALGTYVTSVSASPPLASSGGATPNITHQTSGVTAGSYSYPTVSVNSTGHITSIASGPAPAGTRLPGLYPVAFQSGQGSYDLNAVYGLDGINGSMKLSELYSLANAQAKFPKTFQWYTSAGFGENNAWVMNLYHGNACHLEAVLQGNINTPLGTARIGSNNTLYWPKGIYLHNFFSIFDSNKVYGRGVEGAYIGADNTVMAIDLDGWQGDNVFTEDGTTPARGVFFPSTYENDTALGYQQGYYIHNFRFEGGMGWSWYDTATEDSAITTWDTGECGAIGTVHCVGWNGYGIKNIRGTPGYLNEASTFTCALAGVGFIGSDLSTHRINLLSGDDCPSLLRVRAGFGRPGGGAISIGLIKSESGKRIPIRGQIILDAADASDTTGYYVDLSISNIWLAADFDYIDGLFVIRSFTGGNARIVVDAIRGYNFSTVVQDVTNSKRWANPGSFTNFGFCWNARAGGDLEYNAADGLTATSSISNSDVRLGLLIGGAGSYNFVAGTPTYSITGGTSTPPTPTRTQVFAGAVPSIFTTAQTAQAYHRVIDQENQPMPAETVSWSIQSGPATINASTGLITPTGTPGTVVVRAFCTSIFVDFQISITP